MIKPTFNKLDKDFQLLLSTLPMSVYVTKNPDDETENQIIETRDRFLKLPEDVKNKLASLETSRQIQDIGKKFQLGLFQMASIARIIRNYYFKEVALDKFASMLSEEMKVDQTKAQGISKHITEKILNKKMQEEKEDVGKIENLPILQALKKYPGVGEQLITTNRIKLENNPDLVKPSIKNWIIDYRYIKGNNVFEDLERGNYLFHEKNTGKLTLPERQKLSLILKSLDNNIPLSIDTQRQQIVFSQTKIGAGQKVATIEKQPAKNDWNKIRDNWQKTTSERERNSRQSISKSKGMPREPQSQASAKSPLGSVRDFNFSSPQKFESEKNLDDLKRATNAGVKPPPKTASNDLDNVHSALTEQAEKFKKKEKIKSHKYQIYPIGGSAASHKIKPKIKGNVIDLKGDS